MRRWSASAFRGENLRAAAVALGFEMDALVQRIQMDRKAQDEGSSILPWYHPGGEGFIDLVKFYRRLTLDVVGIAVLGTNFDMVETGVDHEWAKYSGEWLLSKALSNNLPSLVYRLLHYLPVRRLQNILSAEAMMCKYAGDIYDAVPEGKVGFDKADDHKQWNILSTIKSYREPTTGDPVPKDIVIGESALFLSAGSNTAAITLTYITYTIASNPTIAKNLRAEIASNIDDHSKYDVDLLRSLPYLNALIREVLRVYGPSNSFFERITPPTGAVLAGYQLPGGTFVGGQAFSSHRTSLFPNADLVDPERWVVRTADDTWTDRKDAETLRMHAVIYPFGSGIRSCVARPLAEIELMLVTSTIIRNFRVQLHPSVTAASMEQYDVAALKPKGDRCLVRFDYDPIPKVQSAVV